MKPSLTFITGNQHKADYLARYLAMPVAHVKVDLDEIQSLNLHEIVEHKVKQAYARLGTPVIVEDVSLEFSALGGLPGPFIRFFLEQMDERELCNLVKGKSREATARCVFGYCDGTTLKLIEGSMKGTITENPSGDGGYGWDRIFISEGYETPRACLSEVEYEKTYTTIKPFPALKNFLESL